MVLDGSIAYALDFSSFKNPEHFFQSHQPDEWLETEMLHTALGALVKQLKK